jgi:hypothetical protein
MSLYRAIHSQGVLHNDVQSSPVRRGYSTSKPDFIDFEAAIYDRRDSALLQEEMTDVQAMLSC